MDVFEKLKQYAKMESDEDIRRFEIGVWSLAETKDPEVLKKLIDLFDDECPYYEVMYSLVHAIESYPDEIYVKTLISKIDWGLKSYSFWLVGLIASVWNHSRCCQIFKDNMSIASKDSLLKLFDLMEKESPHHQELIKSLRAELAKQN